MKFPWGKKEEASKPKKFVGLSSRADPAGKIVSDIKQIQPQTKRLSLPLPTTFMKPYIDVVKDDIKRLFHKDTKSIQMQQEYEDFMEQYFK